LAMTLEVALHPKHKQFDNRTASVVHLSSSKDLVTATVEEILTLILGERTTEALYSYMLKNFDFRRDEVATKPELFCQAIDKVFGKGGTVIQQVITRNLLDKLGAENGEIYNGSLASAIVELKNCKAL
jgi:hypothetical protein